MISYLKINRYCLLVKVFGSSSILNLINRLRITIDKNITAITKNYPARALKDVVPRRKGCHYRDQVIDVLQDVFR